MVNKKNIGCFQFWFGIALIVIAIVCGILSFLMLANFEGAMKIPDSDQMDELTMKMYQDVENNESFHLYTRVTVLAGVSVIILLLGVLFLTQGLVHKVEESKVKEIKEVVKQEVKK